MFLPDFDNDSLYYLLHSANRDYADTLVSITTDLYFTKVDMAGNQGQGKVLDKNHSFWANDTFTDGMTAVRHGNGRDWWLLYPRKRSNGYTLFRFSPKGFSKPVHHFLGGIRKFEDWTSQMLFTPDGTKFIRTDPFNGTNIFDFDRCSGQLFNARKSITWENDTVGSTGAAVSPNSRFLYISTSRQVFQFDLLASDIAATKTLIATYDGFTSKFPCKYFKMLVAPDEKIYVSPISGCDYLSVIHNPNEKGTACNFVPHDLKLFSYNYVGLPNFPNYRLGAMKGSPCDSLTATAELGDRERFIITPNPSAGQIEMKLKKALSTVGIVQFYNLYGQLLLKKEIGMGETVLSLNLSDWSNGMYYVQIWQGSSLQGVQKITIQKD